MHKLRESTPKRRPCPREVSRYNEHKDDLREDFNGKCGYCDDEDKWTGGKRFFHVDHFVPQKHLKAISDKEYSNLVYSCFFCNNSKRSDWPTNDEHLHNNGREGYIDVCLPEYDAQFYRSREGEIFSKTDLGEYMYRKLKLFLRRHAVIWNMGRLHKQVLEIKEILGEQENPGLKEKLTGLLSIHFEYIQQLIECNEE